MLIKDCIDKFNEYSNLIINENEIIQLYNLIEGELAQEYFPIYKEETWSHYPKVYYKEFSYRPIRIINCENKTYRLYPQYILTKDKLPLGIVKYSYQPNQKDFIDDKSEYDDCFCDCIVYGMLCEYYLQRGKYEIAKDWNHKYKNSIRNLCNEV